MQASPFVLLDNSLNPDGSSFFFSDPESVVICDTPSKVTQSLQEISSALANGLHAAGYFAYELGYLLEPKLAPLFPSHNKQPIIWMGLFKSQQCWSDAQVFEFIKSQIGETEDPSKIKNLSLSMSKEAYVEAFKKAQNYISAGDIYQINLTLKYLFEFSGNPFALYQELRRKQKVSYGGLLKADDFHILSLSPELFFQQKIGTISARPMKGTAPRGLTPETDNKIADWLRADEKSCAENLMIVDLLRNDLGRIAELGSVRVTDLFTVENYRTVLQMTSGITARPLPNLTLSQILTALFPCGSVTGAPKVRAMEIIRELEDAPRGVYTGSMGMISPGGEAAFNVAIRTLIVNQDGSGEMGIGSGVVADSKADAEFAECLLKAEFLTTPQPMFELIETLRFEKGKGYYLLDRHLARLKRSAAHFGFVFDLKRVVKALEAEARKLSSSVHMVRLLLNERGDVTVSNRPIELPKPGALWRFALSDKPVDRNDICFYHKTTRRAFYTAEYDRYHGKFQSDDVVFLNEQGELTEGSRTNIFLKKNEKWRTPALESGVLPGTMREELLNAANYAMEEAVLTLDDLKNADEIYLGNSVRGLVKAEWVNKT